MKICLKIALIFLGVFVYLENVCDAVELLNKALHQEKDSKISKFVCDTVKDLVSKNRQINTISMAIFRNNFDNTKIDETLKCLPKRLSLIITDFRFIKPTITNIRKASIVIIVADNINMVRKLYNLFQEKSKYIIKFQLSFKQMMSNKQTTGGLNHNAKFLIVTSDKNSQIAQLVQSFFPQVGIVDFGVIYDTDVEVFAQISNHFTNSTTIHNGTSLSNGSFKNYSRSITEEIFPDKLKNLNGYRYRVVYHLGMSYTQYIHSFPKPIAKNSYFFDAIAKLQNASIDYIMIKTFNSSVIQAHIIQLINNGEMDITLSESELGNDFLTNVFTYDEKNLCAMIPKTMIHESNVMLIFTRSHNVAVRLCMLLFFLSIAIFWRMYKNHGAADSTFRIVFIIFGSLLGQHNTLNSRNRRVLKIMIQIIFISIVFLRIVYDCSITSKIIKRNPINNIESIPDLISNDMLNITVQKSIENSVKNIMEREGSKNNKIAISEEYGRPIQEIYKSMEGKVVIMGCDFIDHYIRASKNSKHYLLPHHMHLSYIRLHTSHLSLFIDRLQKYMDYAFNSGLTQKWELMYLTDIFGTRSRSLKLLQKNTGDFTHISFNDLKPLFAILLVMCVISTVIFVIEIIWHQHSKNSSWSLVLVWKNIYAFVCKIKNRIIKLPIIQRISKSFDSRSKRQIMNVRRIQVKPFAKNGQDSAV